MYMLVYDYVHIRGDRLKCVCRGMRWTRGGKKKKVKCYIRQVSIILERPGEDSNKIKGRYQCFFLKDKSSYELQKYRSTIGQHTCLVTITLVVG